MMIATFNVNSIRSRLTIVLDWIQEHKPDVLCLQETKVTDPDFPQLAFTELGYHASFHGEKSYNGVAILSRQKPTAVSFGLDDGLAPDETRLAYIRLGSLHVINTYVPQGRDIEHPMYPYKLQWFARLRAYFDRHFKPSSLVAWVGDLNIAPEAMDIHNAAEQENHVCFHPSVRAAFEHTRQWGFIDLFRKYHPEPGQYSYFDYRTIHAVQRKMGWRVDHILTTPALTKRSRDCRIDLAPRLREKPSDHTVMLAEFDRL